MGDLKKAMCKRGLHKMEGHNVIINDDGFRRCRVCQNAYTAKLRRSKRRDKILHLFLEIGVVLSWDQVVKIDPYIRLK